MDRYDAMIQHIILTPHITNPLLIRTCLLVLDVAVCANAAMIIVTRAK